MTDSDESRASPYFLGYENLTVHQLMLRDEIRTTAYQSAILNNAHLFKDKVVMDVGAGTGILSLFCAQAGAKCVYAVEAASDLADLLQQVVEANKFSGVITVVKGEVERLSSRKKIPLKSVDIIVSEWMGFFLLHEGMLESVLHARKYLKKNGLMFPDKCVIQGALCELPEFFDWDNFLGCDLSHFGHHLRMCAQNEPQIRTIKEEHLLSKPIDLFSFEVKSVTKTHVRDLHGEFLVPASRDGKYHGFCIWFKVSFPSTSEKEKVILDTSPFKPQTHWKQTVITFTEEILVEESEPIAFGISFNKKREGRNYVIEFTQLDPGLVTHPDPCDCYETKCKLIKAYEKQYGIGGNAVVNSEVNSFGPNNKERAKKCREKLEPDIKLKMTTDASKEIDALIDDWNTEEEDSKYLYDVRTDAEGINKNSDSVEANKGSSAKIQKLVER